MTEQRGPGRSSFGEARLRLLLEAAFDGILAVDGDGMIRLATVT